MYAHSYCGHREKNIKPTRINIVVEQCVYIILTVHH